MAEEELELGIAFFACLVAHMGFCYVEPESTSEVAERNEEVRSHESVLPARFLDTSGEGDHTEDESYLRYPVEPHLVCHVGVFALNVHVCWNTSGSVIGQALKEVSYHYGKNNKEY